MKKFILIVLSVMMFTGCSAEETKDNTLSAGTETIIYENIIYETFENSTTYWN